MSQRDEGRRVTVARGPVSGRAVLGWRASAEDALATVVAGAGYDRRRMLPRLIAFDVRELSDPGPALGATIKARLQRALRAERQRGEAGHWTYDLNRHVGLMQALAAEEAIERVAAHT